MFRRDQYTFDPSQEPPQRKAMVFVDGENLVARYQAELREEKTPNEYVSHKRDVYVWQKAYTHIAQFHQILRATYYTSAVGADDELTRISDEIKGLEFAKHSSSLLPNFLTPMVFKRERGARQVKGVDIQICIDVLNHVHRRNIDTVVLMTGDGDFEPLIDEVLRQGVQVYLAAFDSGLNRRLLLKADQFVCLGGATWKP